MRHLKLFIHESVYLHDTHIVYIFKKRDSSSKTRDILFIYIFECYLFMKTHFKACDIWILFIHEKYHI